MVVELLNYSTNAIHFGLLIASYNYNISIGVSYIGHIIAAVVKIQKENYVYNCPTLIVPANLMYII